MKRVLFIVAHRPDRSPSQRFRFEQYLNYLEENGFSCQMSYLISEADDAILYQPGYYLKKLRIAVKSSWIRIKDILKAHQFDIIFIQREAYMLGTTVVEKFLARSKAKLIFDLDDAIWLEDASPVNQKLNWLKRPQKTASIIALCDMVFAGNNFLAAYAHQYNPNVKIIPTTIDTEVYRKSHLPDHKGICIGWSGSFTTLKHFDLAIPVLSQLKEQYNNHINFKVIGNGSYKNEALNIRGIPWNKPDEIKNLSSFDIGIMPLPDNEWSKGKCGLKGLQYMALGIPSVMSAVGVNREIVSDDQNGFLATSNSEWFQKLSQLIESKSLRQRIGKQGRKTVEERFSVLSQQSFYLKYFKELLFS